jgi:trimeric autotransporter adhesin
MKIFFTAVITILFYNAAKAQGFSINTTGTPANNSAMLDVQSTTKGLLLPRMTKAQKNAIASPATGLLVYQFTPDSLGFHYYNGTQWLWLDPFVTNAWKITGNTGTDTAVNFIGTADNEPVRFKQNNTWMGQWDVSKNNFSIGRLAGKNYSTGINNIAFGDSALFTNTVGYDNVAIGKIALKNNTDGWSNIAIGFKTLQNNTTGNRNIALGDESLGLNTIGLQNIAIGYRTMPSNISGTNNTGMGFFSLNRNTTGSTNSAYGLFSLYNTTTGDNNTGLGVSAGYGNSTGNENSFVGYRSGYVNGNSNIAIGNYALGNASNFPYASVSNIIAIGDSALYNIETSARENVAVGSKTLYNNTTGYRNTAIGFRSLYNNDDGFQNTAVGDSTMYSSSAGGGSKNTAIGASALFKININSDENTAIGTEAGYNNSGSTNVFVGHRAGYTNTGSGNIFIGNQAGYFDGGSNRLYIDNTSTTTPLIFGDFAANLLRINGILNINNQYSFPVTDGTANQYLRTNGSGVTSWQTIIGESTTANNGLTLTGSNLQLGGVLVSNTTISQGTSNLIFDLSSSGNFAITKSGLASFVARSNGNIGVNVSSPLYSFHVVNTNGADGPFGRGVIIENTSSPTTGEASIAFKNRGTDGLPTYAAWMAGINNFTNYVVAYGDSLIGANVKFKIDTFGNVSVNTKGNAPQSRLDVNGSFGNGTALITADYTAGDDDHTIIIASSVNATPLTVTLPGAGSCPRREYVIVNRNGSAKTITSYNDFSGTSTSIPANGSITLQSVNSGWFRIR